MADSAPTAVIVDGKNQPEVPFEAALTPSPEPFQFSLPTPGAEPITNWRPPLYPVPWAISPYDHFFFTRPIAADQTNWPIADYRYGGVFFGWGIVHTGVDIPSPEGTPIMAAGPGTVVWTGWGLFRETPGDQSDPYGLAVAIRHDFGYKDQQLYTIYAHMSEMNVIVGQHVEAGEVIGFVGSTPVAEYVYARGAAHGKRVQCFGGAKNHMVIMPDADMDQAVDALVGAADVQTLPISLGIHSNGLQAQLFCRADDPERDLASVSYQYLG